MESWIQRVFLGSYSAGKTTLALFLLGMLSLAGNVYAQDDVIDEEDTILDDVVKPDIDRRDVSEDEIDSENFEFGVFAGVLSFEDFGSNNVFGARAAFHLSEDWFLEASYAESELSETSFESLTDTSLLTEEERALDYYNISLGVNLFPGEVFLGRNYAFNTNFYWIFGAGNTRFAEDEFITYNFGGGFRMFMTDWAAFRVDFRNHLLTHNILGEEKSIQNLETHVGLTLFF